MAAWGLPLPWRRRGLARGSSSVRLEPGSGGSRARAMHCLQLPALLPAAARVPGATASGGVGLLGSSWICRRDAGWWRRVVEGVRLGSCWWVVCDGVGWASRVVRWSASGAVTKGVLVAATASGAWLQGARVGVVSSWRPHTLPRRRHGNKE